MRVSDYIVKCLYENGINVCFSITGGFAMHLNDSFGQHDSFKVIYNHHEQSCGYAAVGYTKTINKPSVVCTTAGIAATNAISPCLIAYQDSLPIIFINGQVKTYDTIRTINKKINNNIRNYAFADCDIISMVSSITKYSYEFQSVEELENVMKDAMYNMIEGRPGPIWLSIPLDIQGTIIDDNISVPIVKISIPKELLPSNSIHDLLGLSERPIIIAGNGIKLANCSDKFLHFVNTIKIPVVTSLLGIDLIETNNPLFTGRVGIYGDRLGNFSVQNSDLLLVLGCRLSQGVVGYNPNTFARCAKIIYIDIDETEINKEIKNCTLKIHTDLNNFFENFKHREYDFSRWIDICNRWKNKWLFEMPKNILSNETINPYYALKILFDKAPSNKNIVSMTGSIVTVLWHMINIKKGDKFIFNSQGDMGPELPAAIGTQISEPSKNVFVIIGEGSLQFNLQELQTIVHHKLPIKIIVFNNSAYGAIDITQRTYFKNKFGVDSESGLSFPDTKKIAYAYGIHYISISTNDDLLDAIDKLIEYNDNVILEIFCCIQGRYPKLSSIKNEDGSFTSRPFEDMEPFMARDEFQTEMIVPII